MYVPVQGDQLRIVVSQDAFLPKILPHSKSALREMRHWIPSTHHHVLITPEMLREQSNLEGPWNPNPFDEANDEEKGIDNGVPGSKERKTTVGTLGILAPKKTAWQKVRYSILNRGYIPLVLRFISLIFSILAVILAAFITRNSVEGGVETRPSTVMAFVVNGIAIFYLPWAARVRSSNECDIDFGRMSISDVLLESVPRQLS
jgi:hypothetical protein